MDQLKRRVKITNPFHPRFGEEFELLRYHRSWGHERVECLEEGGGFVSIPLSSTDAYDEDPFIAILGGRSFFRVDELLRLVELIEGLES